MSAVLVNQNKKETTKMTPNDIVTDISTVKVDNINWRTYATYCISGGQTQVADDQSSY